MPLNFPHSKFSRKQAPEPSNAVSLGIMKLLRGALIFFAVAIVTIGSIFYLNRTAFSTVFKNRPSLAAGSEFVPQTYSLAGLTGFSVRHPEFVSVFSISRSSAQPELALAADSMRMQGTLSGLFVLPYAVDLLNRPAVHIDTVLRNTPAPYRKHDRIMLLKKAASNREIEFEDLLELAYAESVQSAQDFLVVTLNDSLEAIPFWLNVDKSQVPVPYWGAWLAYKGFSSSRAHENALRFANDRPFQDSLSGLFQKEPFTDFEDEKRFLNTLPKASPRQMVSVFSQLIDRSWPDAARAEKTVALLEKWSKPKADKTDFSYYISLFDTRLGQLSGVDYGISAYEDRTERVQAVFFDQLPVGLWLHLSSNYMNQDFQQRMIWDPGLRKRFQDSLAVIQ